MKIYYAIFFFLWFTFIIAIPPYALQNYGHANLITPNFWLIFFFLSAITLLVVTGVLIVRQMYPTMFSEAFMGATVVKILGCLIFILVLVHKSKLDKYVFIGDFFYIYFLNTVFEIYILLRTLRHKILR